MDLKEKIHLIFVEQFNGASIKDKIYYHGRKMIGSPYRGSYIFVTDSLGYASGYSDNNVLYTYSIPFSQDRLFSIKSKSNIELLSKHIDKDTIKQIIRESGGLGNEMDWATLSYISTDEFENPEDLFQHLGFYGIKLKEREGIESIYVFDEKNLKFEGKIYTNTPKMIKKIGDFYRDFSKGKNFLESVLTEATVEKDKEYYDEAEAFFERMTKELEEDNYILQNDGNILFRGKEVSPYYYDLWILFTSKDTQKTKAPFETQEFKSGYSFGTYKQYKVIIVNNLKPEDTEKHPEKGIYKDSFIHEFIHYLDFKRSKGWSPNFSEKTTLSDYYNSPTEYNAYYQEAASYIVSLFEKEEMLTLFKKKFKDFHSFYEWMITSVFDKITPGFVQHLNDVNKKKLINRVYNIYDKYFN